MREKLYDEFVRDCGSSCMDEYIAWLEDRVFALETKVEKFTSTNTGSPKFCPHWQVYNRGCSGEFGACDCNGDLVRAKLRAGA